MTAAPAPFKDPGTWAAVVDGADFGGPPCEVCAADGSRCPNHARVRAFIGGLGAHTAPDFSLKVCRKHAKILSLLGHRVPGVEDYFPRGWGTEDVPAKVKRGTRPYKVRGRGARTMRDVLVLAAADAADLGLDFDAWAASMDIPGIDPPFPLPAPLVLDADGRIRYPDDETDNTPDAL